MKRSRQFRAGRRPAGSLCRNYFDVLEDRLLLAGYYSPQAPLPVDLAWISEAVDSGGAFAVRFAAGTIGNVQAAQVAVDFAVNRWSSLPDGSPWIALAVPNGSGPVAFYEKLRNDSRVESVVAIQPVGIAVASNQFLPNDLSFSSMYAMHNSGQSGGVIDADIDAPEGWDVFRGSTAVTVADIDTGVDYEHVDLYKNIWLNPGEIPSSRLMNLVDTDGDERITFWDLNDTVNQGIGRITDANGDGRISGSDVLAPMVVDTVGMDTGLGGWADGISDNGDFYVDDLIGWNFITNSNNPMDDHGHGTHTTGTIGAMGNNGLGVVGVNQKTQVMALKFLSASGSGTDLAASLAIDYSVALGALVSSNSWGGSGFSSLLYDSVNAANSAGQIFVAAAGNYARNNDVTPFYPASFNLPNVVSVGATDSRDLLASFSNYGATTVDLAAPGVGILSTVRNNAYGSMSGTSMATPHVAGAMTALMALHPDWTYAQTMSRVFNTVDSLAVLATNTLTGGRLNLAKALDLSVADQPGSGIDLRMLSATVDGATGLQVTYEVLGADVASFELGFYKSTDANIGGDQYAGSVRISSPAERTVGIHNKTFTLGAGSGQIAVPGIGAVETDTDYRLFVVVDRLKEIAEDDLDPLSEDNSLEFTGTYHAAGGDLFVFGTPGNDVIHVAPSGSDVVLDVNGTPFIYAAADISTIRLRGHSGDDVLTGSTAKTLRIWGGDGNDTLGGGIVSDFLYGGAGSDQWIIQGTSINDTIGVVTESATVLRATRGADIDRFTFDAADNAVVLGSTGNDNLSATVNIPMTLSGEGGNDTLAGGSGNDILLGGLGDDTLNGKLGNDVIVGGGGNDLWSIDGTTVDDFITAHWDGANAQLVFERRASLAGAILEADRASGVPRLSILSNTGNDRVDLSALDVPSLVSAGLVTTTLDGGGGHDTLIGTAGVDTLRGFTGDDSLFGGDGNDVLDGAMGNDTLEGGNGNDSLAAGGGADQLTGNDGNDSLSFLTSQIALTTFDGGLGMDSLITPVAANSWSLSGVNSGTVNGFGFAQVENLTGSSQADTLQVLSGGSLSGLFNASSGTNTLDYSAFGAATTVNLATRIATGLAGFLSVNSFVAPASIGDTIIGPNSTNIWLLNGTNAGAVGTASFSGFENLTGGTANDTFRFGLGASATGSVNGAAGTGDTLDYSVFGAAATVNLQLSTATGVGVFVGMESMIGSMHFDTLIGADLTTLWTIQGAAAGKSGAFNFSSVESLFGGIGADTFKFNAGISFAGSFDGGGGSNTLDYSLYVTAVTVDLSTGTGTGVNAGITNIDNVYGGSAADQLTGNSASNLLLGNAGNDTLNGSDGDDVLVGGTGNDGLSDPSGRNLLIGGAGLDNIAGGTDEDILIAGTTSHDASAAALRSVLSEWQRTDLGYLERINHLNGTVTGGLNGTLYLRSTTVSNDGSADTLTGNAMLDWFWANLPLDVLSDKTVDERLN